MVAMYLIITDVEKPVVVDCPEVVEVFKYSSFNGTPFEQEFLGYPSPQYTDNTGKLRCKYGSILKIALCFKSFTIFLAISIWGVRLVQLLVQLPTHKLNGCDKLGWVDLRAGLVKVCVVVCLFSNSFIRNMSANFHSMRLMIKLP